MWECGEVERLQLEHHQREGRGPLSGPEKSQCQAAGRVLVMEAWSSGVLGRPVVKSLRQEEVRMEGEQHQRCRKDSDGFAHIPLQGKKDNNSDLSTL